MDVDRYLERGSDTYSLQIAIGQVNSKSISVEPSVLSLCWWCLF